MIPPTRIWTTMLELLPRVYWHVFAGKLTIGFGWLGWAIEFYFVGIASQIYGQDTFVSNYSTIKFYTLVNDGPSISDPSGAITGWMAFKFKFVCGSTQV